MKARMQSGSQTGSSGRPKPGNYIANRCPVSVFRFKPLNHDIVLM